MSVLDDLMKNKYGERQQSGQSELQPTANTIDTETESEPAPSNVISAQTPPTTIAAGEIKTDQQPVVADAGDEITPGSQTIKDVQPAEATSETPQKTFKTKQDVIKELRKPAELSPEELEKEKKRERTKAKILAISDALNAVSNLYFTTRGATSVQSPSLSEANKKRYADRLAAREKQQQEYIAALEKAGMEDVADEIRQNMEREKQQSSREIAKENRVSAEARAAADREHRAAEAEKDRAQKEKLAGQQREFTAGQNAANRAQRQQQIEAQQQRARSTNIRYFHQSQGDEIPFMLEGKTYVVGSKALDANVGNFARNILEDARNSPKFKDKTDKDLLRDPEWRKMTQDLTLDRDPKRLSQAVKSYAKYSPATVRDIEQMARYYANGKRAAEQSDDYGFTAETEADMDDVIDIFD